MKAISLWQPWATLWVSGMKINETRSWFTGHTGPLAVHAAKTWNRELLDLCFTEPFYTALCRLRPNMGGAARLENVLNIICPRGGIVGTVHLEGCVRIDERSRDGCMPRERAFGDWTPGRYRWPASKAVRFDEMIPFVGRQGFFEVPDELLTGADPRPADSLFARGGT